MRLELADILAHELEGRPASVALCAGKRNVEASHATQADPPRFPIYSIAKTFIAVLLVQLNEERKLSLEDKLSAWHPEVPGSDRITLRTLLAHRAGLRDYGPLATYHEALAACPGKAWTRAAFAAETWERGLHSEPGARFGYSNPGYRLAREVAERVVDASFAEVVQQRIAGPLGLQHTSALECVADLANCEPGLSTRLGGGGEARDVRQSMDPGWVFHDTLISTASDVLRFLIALAEGALVSPAGLEQMTSLQGVGPQGERWVEPGYGLGLMGDRRSRHGLSWGHDGSGPGYAAAAYHLPQHPAGAVTCVLLCGSEVPDACQRVVERILDLPRPPARPPLR